jgi:hypothetical protein
MRTPTAVSFANVVVAAAAPLLGCAVALLACAAPAPAGEYSTEASVDLASARFTSVAPRGANAGLFSDEPVASADGDKGDFEIKAAKPAFGDEGGHWGTVGFGISPSAYGDGVGYNPTFTYSYFLADGIEMAGELGGWYYDQDGDNAFAINPCAVIRWHFWRSESKDTTVYFDGRIGVLISDDKIPFDGTSFNFTPGFGFGATHRLTDRWRLQAGIRWSHVSNARIRGEEDNPSRDGPLFYTGIIFEF